MLFKTIQQLVLRRAIHSNTKSLKRFSSHNNSNTPKEWMPLISRGVSYGDRVAITDPSGNEYSYKTLLDFSGNIAYSIAEKQQTRSIEGARIGFLCNPGINYVATQWAIWRLGAIAVPLCTSHPIPEMLHVVNNAQVSTVVYDSVLESKGLQVVKQADDENIKTLSLSWPPPNASNVKSNNFKSSDLPHTNPDAGAMIVYTSGTTGLPKGVVTRHSALEAQISDLVSSWKWDKEDRILHFLPLHHVHGIVNKLCCPLSVGAHVEFMDSFDATKVWERLSDPGLPQLSVIMGVPTVYAKLIQAYEREPDSKTKEKYSDACKRVRLMVSGSAALPKTIFEKWEKISGHRLLERYGMTEFGMGISNPYSPVEKRLPGYVGKPLPSARVRLVDQVTGEEIVESNTPGSLCIRGENVFQEYWRNPEATAKDFDDQGWFITGDVAEYDASVDSYRILGRSSVDIIKSGGYKISALHIEQSLLDCPLVGEIAVVGLPDDTYGERLAAVVVLSLTDDDMTENGALEAIKEFAKGCLPGYSRPREYRVLKVMPRNAMGKVNKKNLVKEVFGD